jgi:hypothetical protein
MAIVFIVPKGETVLSQRYVVETAGDHALHEAHTQEDAIRWAKANHHTPHVARVRHLSDKRVPDHWRAI